MYYKVYQFYARPLTFAAAAIVGMVAGSAGIDIIEA